MPRWWKSLCRQARLHNQKEPERARFARRQSKVGRQHEVVSRPREMEALEPRMLMSGDPGPEFGLAEGYIVPLDRETVTYAPGFQQVLEQGRRYFVQTSGSGTFDANGRSSDSEYAFGPRANGDITEDNVVNGADLGLEIGQGGETRKISWGPYQSDHVYGTIVNGQGKALSMRYSDLPGAYDLNTGNLDVNLWEQILTEELIVSSGGASATATQDGSSGTLVTPAVGNNQAVFTLDPEHRFYFQGFDWSKARWAVLDNGGVIKTQGSFSDDSPISVTVNSIASSFLNIVAWYDADGSGKINGYEEALSVTARVDFPNTPPPILGDQVAFQTSQRVDIHGVPLPDASPTGDGEADRVPGMAHVDAYSLLPVFSTTDVAVPVPGGELSLDFRRTLTAGTETTLALDLNGLDFEQIVDEFTANRRLNYEWPIETVMGYAQTTNTASRAIHSFNPDPQLGRAAESITVYDESGAAASFIKSNGSWIPDIRHSFSNQSLRGTLTEVNNGFIYEKTYGTKLYFEGFSDNVQSRGVNNPPKDTYYRLQKIEDRNGNVLQYAYEANNLTGRAKDTLVSRIFDPATENLTSPRAIRFLYAEIANAGPRLVRVIDPIGRSHTYEYFQTEDTEPGSSQTIPSWKVGELRSVVKPLVRGPEGGLVSARVDFDLDSVSRVRIAPSTTGMPLEQKTVYNTRWYLPKTITAVGDPARPESRHVTSFSYDQNNDGDVDTAVIPTFIQAREGSILLADAALVFEQKPVLKSVTTDDGTATFELLDGSGQLSHTKRITEITDTRGVKTRFDFSAGILPWNNDLGFAIALNEVERTTFDNSTIAGIGPNHVVTYTYSGDLHNNLVEVNDISGNVVQYFYESNEIGDTFDAAVYSELGGNRYQVFGQPARSVLAANDSNLAITTEYRYDATFNKLIREVDAEGVVTTYTLDTDGNRTHFNEAVGTSVAATTKYSYNDQGFVTRIEDPDGRVTEFVPNAYGNLEYTILKGLEAQGEDLTPLDNNSFYSTIDPEAKWIVTRRETDKLSTATIDEAVIDLTRREYDPTGDLTVTTYDNWDRALEITPPAVADPEGLPAQNITTTYDTRGNALKQVDEKGNTSVTFYDRLNRPTVTVLDLDGDGYFGDYFGATATLGTTVTDIGQFGLDPDDIGTFTLYDELGLVQTSIDARGFATTNTYDELMRLVRTDLPPVTLVDGTTQNNFITYEYGPNSGSGAFTFGGFNPTRTIDARGFATDTVYDAAYRMTRTTQRVDNGAGIASTDAARADEPSVATTYNKVHNPIRVEAINEASDGVTVANQNSYIFYDHRHRATVQVVDMAGDGANLAAGSFVDDAALFTGHGTDLITRTAFDEAGNARFSTDAEGRVTETIYDGAGRAITVILPVVALYDPTTGQTTTASPTTTTQYNADGLAALTTDANGNKSATYYDTRNRPTVTVLDLDQDGSFALAPGSLVSDALGFPAETSGSGGDDVVSRTVYDLNGNTYASIDPRGNRTDYRYDRANRQQFIIGAAVADAENGGTLSNPTTETVYDKNSNIVQIIDPRNVVTQTDYDQYNRPFRVIANASALSGSSDQTITETLYDANGNALELTLQNIVDGISRPQTTVYTYDEFNRQITQTLPSVGDGQSRITTTEYDRLGKVLTATDAKSQLIENDYDRANRVTQVRLLRADGSLEETRTNLYDRVSNLLVSTDLNGTSSYDYDDLNRNISETRSTPSLSDSYTVVSDFDANGNRTHVTYPDTNRTLVSNYDARNLLVSVVDGADISGYTYDLAGNRIGQTLPNGVTSIADYDALNRVKTMSEQNATLEDVYELIYTYDLVGNRLSAEETWNGAVQSKNTTYSYDDLYRLDGENYTLSGFPEGGFADAPTSGLVAYWSFDSLVTDPGTPGADTPDTSGSTNTHNGNLGNNAALISGAGPFGQAVNSVLRLTEGSGGYVAVADHADLNLSTHTQRTISVWYRQDPNATPGRRQVIYEEGAATRGLNIYLDEGKLYVGGWNRSTPGRANEWDGTFLSTDAPADGEWHHVALVLDGAATVQPDSIIGYLDGSEFDRGDGSQLLSHSGDIGIGNIKQDTRFHDGSFIGDAVKVFAGQLDDFRIYNSALDPQDISILAGKVFKDASSTRSYTYDQAGNRLTQVVDGLSTTFIYDDLNQLKSRNQLAGENYEVEYSYDLNGNRKSKIIQEPIDPGERQSGIVYFYDVANRLIRAQDERNQPIFEAGYDGRTRRLWKNEVFRQYDPQQNPNPEFTTTSFRYDGGVSFQELIDGELTTEFIRGSGMGGGIGSILYRDRVTNGIDTAMAVGDAEAYFNFDSLSGGLIQDQSANAHDATLSGDVAIGLGQGLFGSAAVFGGTDGVINIPDAPSLNSGGPYSEKTIALWFRLDTTEDGRKQILYEQGGVARGLNLYVDGDQLYVGGWNTPTSESGWAGTFLSTDAPTDGGWHHLALVLDGTATVQPDSMIGYLDGSEFDRGEGSQVWVHSDDIGIGNVKGNTRLHDGVPPNNPGTGYGLDGQLDELRLYNRALSGSEIAELAQPPSDPQREFNHYNAVGHVVANTDDAGIITQSNAYDAFGNLVGETGDSDNNRLANTKERDASIGLDNHGFRYYDPEIGRYLTRDPIGYGDGLNVYLSVHNNPVNHIDPLGLEAKGHHIIPRSTFKGAEGEAAEIFDKARLTSPAYEATRVNNHLNKTVETVGPSHNNKTLNGVKHSAYNSAINQLSDQMFGRRPGELVAAEAQQLVAKVQGITDGSVGVSDIEFKKNFSNPGNLLSTIQDFNHGVQAEIAEANANWAQKLGKPAGYVPTGDDIQGYRDAVKAKTAARAAELGGKVRDFGKKLPLIGSVFIGVALVTEGRSAAAQTAVDVSPYGDVRDTVKGAPEVARRFGDTTQAGAQAIRNGLDNHSRAREHMYNDPDGWIERQDKRMGLER